MGKKQSKGFFNHAQNCSIDCDFENNCEAFLPHYKIRKAATYSSYKITEKNTCNINALRICLFIQGYDINCYKYKGIMDQIAYGLFPNDFVLKVKELKVGYEYLLNWSNFL